MTKELNRNIAPKINSIESVNIPSPKKYVLSNGTEVFVFNDDNQKLLKIEFVFENGGSAFTKKPLLAGIVNSLITESTKNFSSSELAEKIDYYGATFETKVNPDYSSVSLYSLSGFLGETLPLLQDVLLNANYNQKDLDIHLARRKQEFMVNSSKVDFIARQNFTKLLFGENHPYGKSSVVEDYDKIERDELLAFYNDVYKNGKHKIFIAGKFGDTEFELLNSLFGTMTNCDYDENNINWEVNSNKEKYTFIKKEGAVQNAIRMGFIGLERTHEDYNGLRILTTFLGGYFGSRLMNNIREDKGYTYGIGAAHSPFAKKSVFFIATEVKTEVVDDTLKEIKLELNRFKEELITEEELQTVVNYLQGSFQRQFDGSLALLNRYITLSMNNLDYSYYYQYIDKVKNITVEELKQLANKYFSIENFFILNVGN